MNGAPAPRPSGTIALLFTDIEGSTQRWERFPEAMGAAIARHDALLRETIESRHGYVFKTVGDAFCSAFARIDDALAAAVALQRALARENFSAVDQLRVRAALHVGAAESRDGDYFGPSLNRVARLLSAGHGGQTLLSDAARASLSGAGPIGDVSFLDLGQHRLKDLSAPERIFQLVASDLPGSFASLLTLDAMPNNLPHQLGPLVARERELRELLERLDAEHLICLVATGGIGKTRLAVQAGAELLERFPDGVWFDDLAPLAGDAAVAQSVAALFHLRAPADVSLEDAVVATLKDRTTLLILDNCEHLIEAAARFTSKLLAAGSTTRVLATSREPLNVRGERVVRLAPLERDGAVALFLQRAVEADARFAASPSDLTTVAAICERLDGIALAIELAAARTRVLSVAQLFERLNERFRLLAGGSREALPRQQTMRALVDWSYDLLHDAERTLLQRLAVFAASFSLDAATAVCSDERIEEWDLLDRLESLADKSLVVTDVDASLRRYRLLVTIREYAAEKLVETGADAAFRARHAAHFARWAETMEARFASTPTSEWSAAIEAELLDVRAALAWSLSPGGDRAIGVRLVGALRSYFQLSTNPRECLPFVDAALEAPSIDGDDGGLLRAHLAATALHAALYDFAKQAEHARLAVAIAERRNDPSALGEALLGLAGAEFTNAAFDHEGTLNRAESIFEAAHEARMLARTKLIRGRTLLSLPGADRTAAKKHLESALAIAREISADSLAAAIEQDLAEIAFDGGNGNAAEAFERSGHVRDLAIATRNGPLLCAAQINLCAYALALGNTVSARTALSAAVDAAIASAQTGVLEVAGLHAGVLAARRGDLARAHVLRARALARYRPDGSDLEPTERFLLRELDHTGPDVRGETARELTFEAYVRLLRFESAEQGAEAGA